MRSSWLNALVVALGAITVWHGTSRAAVPQAAPYYVSGRQLYDLCRLHAANEEPTACEIYIQGVVDYIVLDDQTMSQTGLSYQPSWCASPPLKFDRIYKIVFKYLASHPPDETESAAASVYMALATAFPCPPQSSRPLPPRR